MSGATPNTAERALALTREMLAAAQAEDWDALAQLDAQRQPMLRPQDAPAVIEDAIWRQMLECNEQIVACVRNARDRVATDWQDTRNGHRAAQDYQRVAREGEG